MNQSGKYLQQPGVLHVKRSTCYDTSEVLFHQNDGTEMKTNTRFFTNVQACKCDDNMAIESSSNLEQKRTIVSLIFNFQIHYFSSQ